MKKILLGLVLSILSLSVLAQNNALNVNELKKYKDEELRLKAQQQVQHVTMLKNKDHTHCFILKRKNKLKDKLEFSSEFCIVNEEEFVTKSITYTDDITENNTETVQDYEMLYVNKYIIMDNNLFIKLSYEYQMIIGWKESEKEIDQKILLPLRKKYNIYNSFIFNEKGEKKVLETTDILITLEML